MEGCTQATFKVHLRSNIATLRRSKKGKEFTKKCPQKILKIHRKEFEMDYFINKVADCSLSGKEFYQRSFPMAFANFFRTAILWYNFSAFS